MWEQAKKHLALERKYTRLQPEKFMILVNSFESRVWRVPKRPGSRAVRHGLGPMLTALPTLVVLCAACLVSADPPGWQRVPASEAGDDDGTLEVAFALRLSSSAVVELEKAFMQVSRLAAGSILSVL